MKYKIPKGREELELLAKLHSELEAVKKLLDSLYKEHRKINEEYPKQCEALSDAEKRVKQGEIAGWEYEEIKNVVKKASRDLKMIKNQIKDLTAILRKIENRISQVKI